MVLPFEFHKAEGGHANCQELCHDNRQPNAVQIQDQGQKKHRSHLEQKEAQEGQGRRNQSVVEGGEERRCEDVDAQCQEADGIEPQTSDRHFQKSLVVACKDLCQRLRQKDRGCRHGNRAEGKKHKALAEQALQFSVIARAKMEAHNGRHANGISDKDRQEHKSHVQDHAVRRNAVLARILHEAEVVKHIHQRQREIGHHLRGAVGASL